ncbi:unnamed protein product [Owenia fusiformis]|uniref:Zinc transporter ZIP3 n=1 Tax=Owenia fusiformis TaxID=6347 RepID=A0A8J1U7B8_OWEFU|nr:unnamed protein product [Owenia fusiformis]
MDTILARGLCTLAILAVNFIACILPLKIIPRDPNRVLSSKSERIISFCNCFAGGVFLGTCFIALLPNIHEKFNNILKKEDIHIDYPVTEFAVVLGFFLVVFIEKAVMKCNKNGYSHLDSDTDAELELNSIKSKSPMPRQLKSSRTPKEITRKIKSHRNKSNNSAVTTSSTSSTSGDDSDQEVYNSLITHKQAADPSHVACNTSKEHGHRSGHNNGHGHSHMIIPEGSRTAGLRSFILLLALSIHGIFEGMVLGLQTDLTKIINLFIAILIHESLVSFALGMNLAKSNLRVATIIKLSIVFVIMIPIGVAIGIGLGEVKGFGGSLVAILFEALAAGTFLYVLFLEILPGEISNDQDPLLKLLFIFIGFVVLSCLPLLNMDNGH